MALEDFFTLNEMNDGLSVPDRVKELVGLMQKKSDCVSNNISDTTRQWSAVGSAIAGTENKECLLLFVQLDGLIYMNRWLKDASDLGSKTSDSSLEDTIINLLRAVSRIVADNNDKLVTSEVWMTVKYLLGHTNPKVRDMANSLLEMQSKEKPRDVVMKGEDIAMTENTERGISELHSIENFNLVPSNGDIDTSQGILTSEFRQETAEDDLLSTACEYLKDEEINKTSLDGAISNEDIPYSADDNSFPEPVNDNLDKLEPPISCSDEAPSAEACGVVGPKQGIQKEEINGFELDPIGTEKSAVKIVRSPQIHDKEKDPKATPSTNDMGTFRSVTKPCDIKDDNAEEKDTGGELSDFLKTDASEDDKKMNDKSSGYDRSIMAFRMKSGGKHDSNMLVVSNTSGLKPEKDSGRLFQRTGNIEVVEGHINSKVEGYLTNDCNFSKQKNRRKDHSIETKSDFDLDYGIADPLELARLVAIEVEREVEDCRELSCSSSDKKMSSRVQRPESSHSATGEQSQAESSAAEVSSQPDLSIDSPSRDDHVTSAQSMDPLSQEARSPQVTEAADVIGASTDGGLCHFDLNQDVCSEDVQHQGDTTSPPISVVSTTREAGPSMHVGPFQFEGALGLEGSAATSVFMPASPLRVPECISAGGSNSSSKENPSLLNIDLNAAEIGDDKQIPVSFQHASLESSAVASSKRSERLEFDLNQISNDGAPLDLQPELDLFHQRSGHHNQSSSSSSSSKQSSLRNFDLNDQPKVANGLSSGHFYPNPSQSLFASGTLKSDDSVISIMGMRVEVNCKDSSSKPVPLSNGRIPEHTIGFNLERPGSLLAMGPPASYPHPHIFALNGLPPGSSIAFPSPIYGSGGAIPYMVDSRGSPLVPQFMTSSANSTSFLQAPHLFSMPGANGVGLSRDNFDLNSGMYPEGSGLELGGFRQLFNPQPRPFVEHLKANSQPSTSSDTGVGGKRKEPESVWESYPFKHQQPWR
ncbi:hypothetical protein Leryth_022589 [Lithospermum erythrorhizon]|nr:hypothetical protein Leryth_022589 [Lithospermum erythrorhizon]